MILALALACAPRTAPPTPLTPSLDAKPSHGSAALSARNAVVMDDLSAFTAAVRALSGTFPLADRPIDPQAELMVALASADAAKDGADAAASLGRLAAACGSCHVATEVTLATPLSSPAPGDGVRAEMKRHDRALDLVWRGLIGPDEASLQAGATAFRASTLAPVSGVSADMARILDDTVTTIAEGLARPTGPATRGALFGALVATCAACHRAPPEGLIEPE